MKLTKEELQIIHNVLDSEDLRDYFDSFGPEYKAYLLEQGKKTLDFCKEYKKGGDNNGWGNSAWEFALIMDYDMWVNHSNVWPVMYNPDWEKTTKKKKEETNEEHDGAHHREEGSGNYTGCY
jgi:hypothetical protein